MKKMGIILAVVVGLVVLAFATNYFSNYYGKVQNMGQMAGVGQIVKQSSGKVFKTLKIGEVTLNVEVADTDEERIRGLSGKEARQNDPVGPELGENEGMLFVFDKEGYYGIWMKDMKFPIDIAWLDKDKKITHIENAVGPETFPKVFNSQKDNLPILNLYVLETNASFFENHKIKIGDIVEF